jgi:hypothetical protein
MANGRADRRPISALITVPPVMIAMSRSIPLHRSPKPGLDGRGLDHAAELVDDERRHRLTIDVLGDDQQGLPLLDGLLEGGSMS